MENVIIEAYGLKYVVDKNAKFIVEESYETFMKDLVKLKPGNVFVDVGAHVGKYSFYAAKQVGTNGLVIAIEPHPKNAENLRKGIELNGLTNVEVVEKACSNYSGTGFLIEYELSARHELSMKPTRIKVKVDMLDNILQSLRINKVDMIKIDVNGHEHEVLEGSQKTLKSFKPAIIMEVMLENKQKVFQYLKNFGYKPKILSEEKRYLNALFSHKEKNHD